VYAILYGSFYAARLLLKTGVNVNGQNAQHETPLIIAIKTKQPMMVYMLVHHGANTFVEDANGVSMTDLAKNCGDPEVYPVLIGSGRFHNPYMGTHLKKSCAYYNTCAKPPKQ